MGRKVWGDLSSDHLAVAKAFETYNYHARSGDRSAAAAHCDRFGLSASALDDIAVLRRQFFRHLGEIGFADASAEEHDGGDVLNTHSKKLSLLRCVLCAGLFPNVAQVQREANHRGTTYSILVSRDNEKCCAHPSSLLFKQTSEFAAVHGWLLFTDKMKTSQVYLHNSTLIGAIPILLFGGALAISAKDRSKVLVEGLAFDAKDEKCAVLFKTLRREIDRLLLLKITDPRLDLAESATPLLQTVVSLLEMEDLGSSGKR